MFLIDFENTPGQAFLHGLVKGLAAPTNLYHTESFPAIPKVIYISAPNKPAAESLAGDWQRIGNDIQNVITQYGTPLAK